MKKIDYKKEYKNLYNPSSKEVVQVNVPKMNFAMIDGQGDPNHSAAFQEAVEALYGISYTLKFMLKKSDNPVDYTVMGLEGLWWMDDMREFSLENKDQWKWTLMIMQPEFITQKIFDRAVEELRKKKNPAALSKLRLEAYDEGLSAQIMHIGPFSAEGPTIEKIHGFIKSNGYKPAGKHHEIYLSDYRKVPPEKLKTVLRQPMKKDE